MAHFFKKISIRHAGKMDARGHYGKYLLDTRLGNDYKPSPFMLNLADRYDKDCNTLERRALATKHIRNCIHRAYGPKKQELDKIRFDIEQAKESKQQHVNALADKEKELVTANQWKDAIESEKLEGSGSIYDAISNLYNDKDRINKEIDGINKTIASCKEKEQGLMQDKRLLNLYKRYNAHIGSLSEKMKLKKNQYDEEMHLYWTALMKKLAKKYPTSNKISLKQMTFSDICEMKEVSIRGRKDVFRNDQAQIQKKLAEFNIE